MLSIKLDGNPHLNTQTYSICEKLCLDTFLTHLSALLSFYRIWAPNLSLRMTFVQYQISKISLVFKHFNPFWNVFLPFLKCFWTHSGIVILLCFIIIFCNIKFCFQKKSTITLRFIIILDLIYGLKFMVIT